MNERPGGGIGGCAASTV